ncbi:hypothetical protein [Phytomonospora endophytica]|uniref:Iron ABC transporter permease n=1 Tax=Phytomonospora endophytica TaxID=714109 RepID=A0A841FHP1_9ACTN|nr:hypothetical protein [Phytomonospora endophytica]MBB6036861.1 hypothetical protein [Phytomonospora endophytica]GIG68105.1 hypothetical protein Pen01_44000 [Phytomonospora endophytica]
MPTPPTGLRMSRLLLLAVLVIVSAAAVGTFAGSGLPAEIGAWALRVFADVRSASPFS